MKLSKVAPLFVIIFIASSFLLAQTSPNLENGFKNYGSYDGSHLDTVNLMNGNLMLHIPVLPAFGQRGEFAPQYSLYVTSKSWQVHCKPDTSSSTGEVCWWESNNPGVMVISAEGLLASRTLVKDFSGTGQIFYTTQGYSVTGPDGSVHQFAPVPGQPLDAYSNPTVLESLDTSGYHLVVSNPDINGVMNNVTIIDRKGIQYPGVFSTYTDFKSCYHPGTLAIPSVGNYAPVIDDVPFGEGFCQQVAFATQVTDPNGNQMNFARTTATTPPIVTTDTLGRNMPFSFIPATAGTADPSKCVSVSGRAINSTDLIYYNAPDGTTQSIQRCYAYTPIQTAFGVTNVVEAPSSLTSVSIAQLLQLVTVVLADGSKWTFDYDSYGNVIYAGLPAGGHISYTWTEISIPPSVSSLTGVSRAVHTRTLVDSNGNSSQWSYSWGAPGKTITNKVTDPAHNDTVHVFTALDGIASFYETTTQYFQGPQQGQPLKQVDTTYAPTTVTSDDGSLGNVVPASIKTTVNPSGKVNLVTKQYDAGFGAGSSIFANVVKEFEYDWGQGAPGPLLRETDTTYQWQTDSRYLTAHLVDLPASVVIRDGGGCALSETDYAYDEPTYFTTTTVGTQHVAAPNPAPVRGNQTTVTRWLTPTSSCNPKGGTAITSHTNWYDTGEPHQSIDPLGHTTTHSYDPFYVGAYATQTCSPQTGSVTHCVSGTYDFNTGVLTSLTNENATAQASGNTPGDQAHTGNYSYDYMFRITSAQAPPDPANGGSRAQTSFTFSAPNTFPLSVQRTKSITTALSDSASNFFDGLGRANKGQHVLPNGTATVDTTFDLAGHPATVSNPYFTTSDPTYGLTANQYDALDRVTQTTKQDGSISTVSYDQAAPGVAGVCIVSADEAGKQRRGCSDALGRLTEVDEPNPGSQPIPAQGAVNISGALKSQAGVGAYGSATATAQVTIGGADGTHSIIPTCTSFQIRTGTCDQTPEWVTDTGTVHITMINGHEYDYQFGQGSGPDIQSTVAQGLVTAIQADSARVVNASISSSAQNVVVLTALSAGAAGNSMAFSTGSTSDFTTSPASGNLAGGVDIYPGVTVYDKGTVALTVGGFSAQACYGRSTDCAAPPAGCATGDSTSAQVACILASGLNASGSPVTASYSGSTVTVTYKTAGAAGNGISLTSSSQSTQTAYSFSPPSFCAPPGCNTTLANGLNALDLNNNPFVTQYQYDGLGNLLRVDQKGSAPSDSTQWRTRTFTYDSLSRLLTATNPESGTITYLYDADGELLQKTSPAPNQTGTATQTVSYCYDALHRVTGKGYGAQSCPLTTPVVTYVYDSGTNAIGHLTSLTDQAGTATYTYDILGRLAAETRAIAGVSKSTSYTYNLDGSVKTLTYPSGRVVTYTPGTAGMLTSAADGNGTQYVSSATYYATGSEYQRFMPGIYFRTDFNPRLQVSGFYSNNGTDTGVFVNKTYDYGAGHNNGNVISITNNKDSNRTQMFTYDALNRLTSGSSSANTGVYSWGENYSIDAWSNLQISPMSGKAHGGTFQLSGNAQNRPTGLAYDAAGNLMSYLSSTYTYDQENRLSSTAGMTYTYDANGERVLKSNTSTGAAVKRFWSMGGNTLSEGDGSGNLTAEYIYFGGKRVARIDLPANTVHYYLSDHLSSTSIVASVAGAVEEESDYYPFGTEVVVTGPGVNELKFTGKRRDTESQLDLMGARFYSNAFGRFTKPDPLIIQKQKLSDPQQWNMYQYARNNPLRFVDPTGKAVQLSNDDKERARQLAAAQKAVGADAGKYLYDNKDKDGNHFLGVYKGGPDGKGPDFSKVNAAAGKLNGIIQDSRVATVQMVQPGFVTPKGTLIGEIGGASPAATTYGSNSATIYVTSGNFGAFPGEMLSDGWSRNPSFEDILSHEIGHLDSKWFHGDIDSKGDSVRMENETRKLNGEPLRLGHDRPNDVILTGAPY